MLFRASYALCELRILAAHYIRLRFEFRMHLREVAVE